MKMKKTMTFKLKNFDAFSNEINDAKNTKKNKQTGRDNC